MALVSDLTAQRNFQEVVQATWIAGVCGVRGRLFRPVDALGL